MSTPLSSGAGRLRHLVTVEQNTGGQATTGEQIQNWTPFATVYAAIEPARGREFFSAGRIDAETTHLITIRYLAGLDETMRITWNGRVFDINAVVNVDERNRDMEITATERKNQ